jgi:hypothetical protein
MEVKLNPFNASTLRDAIDDMLLSEWTEYTKKLLNHENVSNVEKQRKILESFSNRAFNEGLKIHAKEVSIKVKKEDVDSIRSFLEMVLTKTSNNDTAVIESVINQLKKTSGGSRKKRKNRRALSRKRKN